MPRKKKVPEFADEQEEKEEELEWDKKKIIGAFIVLFLLIVGGVVTKHFIFPSSSQSVQGASTSVQQNESLLPSSADVKKQIDNIQSQVSQLSVQDIASSSPQVQQILDQLKKLPNTPGNVLKQTCENICKGL